MHRSPRSTGQRAWIRRFAVLLVVAISVNLGMHSPAYADGEFWAEATTACKTSWTVNGSSAEARAALHYNARTSEGWRAVIQGAHATLESNDCGPAGRRIEAASMTVTATFTLYGSGVECNLSISLPPGITYSCNGTRSVQTIQFSHTCTRKAFCDITLGTFYTYPDRGQRFANVIYMQVQGTLSRPGASPVIFNTPRA